MIVFVMILVLFGGAKLPEMARNLGKGMRAFRQEAHSLRREPEGADGPQPAPAEPAAEGEAKAESAKQETSKA